MDNDQPPPAEAPQGLVPDITTTTILQDFPALRVGHDEGDSISITDIKSQWLRYNHHYQPPKDVLAMTSDAKKGLWKSICACVKGVKTVKEWKNNGICQAHIFVTRNQVKSVNFVHECTDQHAGRQRNYNARQLHMASEELRTLQQQQQQQQQSPSSSSNKNNKRARRGEAAQEYMQVAQNAGFAMHKTQAYKVVFRMSRQPIEVQIGEFYLLQSIFRAWKRADPDGNYSLDTTATTWKPQTEQFQRYYIAPSISKNAWKHSKINFFVSDASETSTNWSSFQMSLLLAVTLDGNNDVVLLAMALCDSPSELNWIWFLQNIMRDYSNIHVFLSDSECVTEGTNIPNLLQLMNAVPSRCITSLIESLEGVLTIELSKEEKYSIQELAKATSPQAYDAQIRTLARTNPDVAVWLDERKSQFVAFCLLEQQPKRTRFGTVVSKANELVHDTIQEVKDQPVASMTTSLLMNISSVHLERRQQAQTWLDEGQLLSDYAKDLYATILQDSTTCQVQVLSQDDQHEWKAIVSQPKQGGEGLPVDSFVVTANTAVFQLECSCQFIEEMGLPCVHGVALLRTQNLPLHDVQWFHPRYHSVTLVHMYDAAPPDFSLFGKLQVQEMLPPEHKVWRPLKRRKVPTAQPNNPHKCAACGELGHHPKTCHQPSTQYRYEQFADKAMEWAESSVCGIPTSRFF
jgi:hypothetical protein